MDTAFTAIASLAIGLLFALSFLHKVRNFQAFTSSVRDYQLLWPRLIQPVAAAIVLAELAVVITLVSPESRAVGGLLAIVLLLLYAGGIGINLARGRTDISCGCSWGRGHQPIRLAQVLRNLVIAGLATIILLPDNGRELLWLDQVSVVLACLVVALIYLTAEELVRHSATTP